MKKTFWVLQWSDGTYYAKGWISGFESITHTQNVMEAVRFETFKYAKSWHDGRGHFWHQDMKAVKVVLTIDETESKPLPGRKERKKEKWEEDENDYTDP